MAYNNSHKPINSKKVSAVCSEERGKKLFFSTLFFPFSDSDGNGAIDFPEFLSLMTKNIEDCDPEDILLESFKVFDRDNSGFIGVSELDRVFKLLGQEFKDYEIEAMIKAADSDGDGLVGWDDFTKMMKV